MIISKPPSPGGTTVPYIPTMAVHTRIRNTSTTPFIPNISVTLIGTMCATVAPYARQRRATRSPINSNTSTMLKSQRDREALSQSGSRAAMNKTSTCRSRVTMLQSGSFTAINNTFSGSRGTMLQCIQRPQGLPVELILSSGRMTHSSHTRQRYSRGIRIRALDAAMPFDYESIQRARLSEMGRLKIGLLGFGNFGQFLAKRIMRHKHDVIAWNRSDYSDVADSMGVRYFRDLNDFCEDHPDVVVLSSSILSAQKVLEAVPLQRLRRNTLFADVLSVKVFPKTLFLQALPQGFDILCTHPMFGPASGKGSWDELPFVFEKVRLGEATPRIERCERFLKIFEDEGCRMVEMSCEEHDQYAAGTQFVTHTVGRMLGKLELKSTPINTKGYETLLNLVENTSGDSFDLYYGLFMYNTNATEELQRFESAFDAVKKQLLDQLHSVVRAQLLGASSKAAAHSPKQRLLLSDSSSNRDRSDNGPLSS